MNKANNKSRRSALKTIGLVTASIPLTGIIGCGSKSKDKDSNDDSDSSNSDSDNSDTNTDDRSNPVETSSEWAAGGTELISENFPDDTLFATSSACTLAFTGQTTEGPCYFSVNEREDISEGYTGLPMMLCLQVIDESCIPLEGVVVEVWHCDKAGIYSADTSNSDNSNRFAGSFCTGGNAEAENNTWYRGELITNSSGRVNFKTCFPGWYSGRTIHIHFRVRNNSNDYVISQFCFSDDFCNDICTAHTEYSARGSQDTPLNSGRDTVFGSDYQDYQFNIKQNSDGTLLAYKTIQISY